MSEQPPHDEPDGRTLALATLAIHGGQAPDPRAVLREELIELIAEGFSR